MTINNGASNTADFNTATYHLMRLLIPREKTRYTVCATGTIAHFKHYSGLQ